jgi:hypothetical protein
VRKFDHMHSRDCESFFGQCPSGQRRAVCDTACEATHCQCAVYPPGGPIRRNAGAVEGTQSSPTVKGQGGAHHSSLMAFGVHLSGLVACKMVVMVEVGVPVGPVGAIMMPLVTWHSAG